MSEAISDFNTVTGLIFDQLYQSFPTPSPIRVEAIADAMGLKALEVQEGDEPWMPTVGEPYEALPSGRALVDFVDATIRWLSEEGFIRTGTFRESVLTAKALTIMNATPDSLNGESLGATLSGAAKSAGTEAGRAAISETVGQIIGAAAKAMAT
jgi:hypothetical protein